MSRWLLAALVSISGCAFGLDGPDPNRPRNKFPECDTSKALVVLDGTMATGMGVLALSLLEPEPAIALLPLAIGALYLGGAVKGNTSVNKCREAMKEYADGYSGERFAGRGAPDDDEDDEDDNGKRRGRVDPRLPPQQQMPPQQVPPQQMPPQQLPPQQMPPQQVPPQHMYPPQQMPPQQMPPQQMPPQQVPPQQVPPQQQPAPQQPPAQGKAPAKGKRPPAPADDDDWTDFWREVP